MAGLLQTERKAKFAQITALSKEVIQKKTPESPRLRMVKRFGDTAKKRGFLLLDQTRPSVAKALVSFYVPRLFKTWEIKSLQRFLSIVALSSVSLFAISPAFYHTIHLCISLAIAMRCED